MITGSTKDRDFLPELIFKATKSSGSGGQNVNKVNTRVELKFKIFSSQILTEEEKIILSEKLSKKINSEGELIIVSQKERSQLKNKIDAIQKFYKIIEKALFVKPKRKRTKPSKSSVEKRLSEKKIHSEKKSYRKKV